MRCKKIVQKITLIICSVMFLTGCFPSTISAATLNFNKTATITVLEKDNYVNTKKYTWIKYKAPNNGYITITVKNKSAQKLNTQNVTCATGILKLYNSTKKKALSGEYSYNTASQASADYTVTYGVKKNTTYYLRVKAQGAAAFKCKFSKISQSGGSTKKKAKLLSSNKEIKGVIAAGDKTVYWYKIKITKKQILNLYYFGATNDKIKLTFSGTYLQTTKKYVTRGVQKEQHTYSLERVQPGTYYIKVEPNNALSSGYYTLRWK